MGRLLKGIINKLMQNEISVLEQYIYSVYTLKGTIVIIFLWKNHLIILSSLANLLLTKVCFGHWHIHGKLTS